MRLEFSALQWPAQSPDLNSEKYLWDVAEQKIHSLNVQQQTYTV